MEEAVDYISDSSIPGDERTTSDAPMPEVQPPTALSPFFERDDMNAPLALHSTPGLDDAIITNPLDERRQLTFNEKEAFGAMHE
uniref:Uncharacterized protein n=1 Tax=Peronospora matthiolae TaxID=2874970 RepID=A0AAV1VAN4_9STRA